MSFAKGKMLKFLVILFCVHVNCKKEVLSPENTEVKDFELISPIDSASGVLTTDTFKWQTSAHVGFYHLIVSQNPDLSEPVFEKVDITDTVFLLSEIILPGGSYYWTVFSYLDEKQEKKQAQDGIFSFSTKFEKPTSTPEISMYYVSTDGIDNAGMGTKDKPFRTISYAAKMTPADEGDTIYVMAGEYTENKSIVLPTGVNLIGERKETVIIKSSGVQLPSHLLNNEELKNKYQSALIQLVSSGSKIKTGNQEIANLTIDGRNKSLKAGIWAENRSGISIHDVHLIDIDYRGIVVATSDKPWYQEPNEYLTNISIYNCSFNNCSKDFSDGSSGNLNIGQLNGALIHDIIIEDNQGYGIKFMWDGYFKSCKLYNIKTTLNESDKLWGEDIAIELWNLGPGNEIWNVESNTWLSLVNHPEKFGSKASKSNLVLYDIKIIDHDVSSQKEGIELGLPHVEIYDCYIENKGFGIALWNMGRENITIRNNIIRNTQYQYNWTGGSAIYIDNSQSWDFNNIHIYNNVFDKNVYSVRVKGKNIENIFVKNNLFINSKSFDLSIEEGNLKLNNNFLHVDSDEDWKIEGKIDSLNNFNGDAELNQEGTFYNNYYRPSSESSPLIDAGVDLGFPYNGSAPDIGVFEYIGN